MIAVYESTARANMTKPVICPKCGRGRIGNIPIWSEAALSRRGRPPPEEHNDGVQVKCNKCNTLWTLTIE